MAGSDETDQENKTFAASERRLHDAFEQGQLPMSRDVASWAALAGATATLGALAPSLRDQLTVLVASVTRGLNGADFSTLPRLVMPVIGMLLLPPAAGALAALIVSLAQTQAHLWTELLAPDFSRLFNMERVTRLFSKEVAVDLGMALVKALALMAVVWATVRAVIFGSGQLLAAPTSGLLGALFNPVWSAGVKAVALLMLLAGADLALTRFRFAKKMMMTRDEQKREMKEDEGDPLFKSRRKRRHRELTKANAIEETKRADAIVVNPTHVAVAIRYRRDEGGSPRVIAKGKGSLAEVIREVAQAHGIPIIENIPLARLLHRKVKVGGAIPKETFKAVAAILAFVYRVTGINRSARA